MRPIRAVRREPRRRRGRVALAVVGAGVIVVGSALAAPGAVVSAVDGAVSAVVGAAAVLPGSGGAGAVPAPRAGAAQPGTESAVSKHPVAPGGAPSHEDHAHAVGAPTDPVLRGAGATASAGGTIPSGTAGTARAPASASADASSPAGTPAPAASPLDQGGVPAPQPSRGAVPRQTVGQGVYDVVVVPLSLPGAQSPAVAGGAEQIIPAADAIWREATDGRFRLDLRAVAFAEMDAGDPCDLDQVAAAIEPAVARVTDGGEPRPGRVGVLAVAVVAPGLCEVAGLGYIGANVALVVGHWDEVEGPMVVAHEAGHTFGLGHADAIVCPGPRTPMWQPAWPCAPQPYGDHTSVMGNDPQPWERGRLGAAHLRRLGLLREEQVIEVPRTPTEVQLHPVYGAGSGPRAAAVTLADGGRWLVEYRPGGSMQPGDGGVFVRSTGTSANGPDTALVTTPGRDAALRGGEAVILPGGTTVAVLSTGERATVRIIPPAAG